MDFGSNRAGSILGFFGYHLNGHNHIAFHLHHRARGALGDVRLFSPDTVRDALATDAVLVDGGAPTAVPATDSGTENSSD